MPGVEIRHVTNSDVGKNNAWERSEDAALLNAAR